jgi:hypothetical protein
MTATHLAMIEADHRAANLEVAYKLLHSACSDAEKALRDGGTFPINGILWNRLRVALVDCEEFLGRPV